jgi:hypothetical protein
MIKHLTIIIKNLNFKVIRMLDSFYNLPESLTLKAILMEIIIGFKGQVQTNETSYYSMPL